MNVIFLDFDGVIDTYHFQSYEDMEKKVKILADICHEYDCKVVIEASVKTVIDYDTLEVDENVFWVRHIFECFKKYGIECIGRTPNDVRLDKPLWKEDEIRAYLAKHPEIEHFCVIDDDDLGPKHSDLSKLDGYVVRPLDYCTNPFEEGLLPKHKEEVGRILQKENNIRKLILKYKK